MVRLARGDVNMPDFEGFPIHVQVPEVRFEAATYDLLRSAPAIRASRLLHHRIPEQRPPEARKIIPTDIAGRRMLLFEKSEGVNNVWWDLSPEAKVWPLLSCFLVCLA